MATIAENLNRIVDAKEAIKGAIIDKGVQVPSDAKIDEYSTFIGQIQGGGGEDTLKMYIDGTIVKDGVLDLSNYDTLLDSMFNNDRWRNNIDKIILSQNIETIPDSCFQWINTPLVENLDKVKYIRLGNAYMTNMSVVNLESCVNELTNVGSTSTHTKIYGENVKIISLEDGYNLQNLYIYSINMPKINKIENVSSWVYSKTLHCHCWMDGATTNILVTDKGYSVNYLEELISQTYTGETEFDVDKIKCTLTLPYSFAYTEDGEEKTKDIVYNKELNVYPVKEETKKVVPITTAQSTDEFTLNMKPYPLKAPDMDLYYEFEVMEELHEVNFGGVWVTDGLNDRWQVWCDGELTTPDTLYNFSRGEKHTFALKTTMEFLNNDNWNISYNYNTRNYLKPTYMEVNKAFNANVPFQRSPWYNERFMTLVVNIESIDGFEISYGVVKELVYLKGINENGTICYNGWSEGCNIYIVADNINKCGRDIREYRYYGSTSNVYLKSELAQQLWDEDEYFKRYIYKYDIE